MMTSINQKGPEMGVLIKTDVERLRLICAREVRENKQTTRNGGVNKDRC